MSYTTYTDTLHGFIAHSRSKTMAWMLIREKCREQKLEIPTLDKIIEKEVNDKIKENGEA